MKSGSSELRFLILGSLLVLAFMGLLERMDIAAMSSDTITPRPSGPVGKVEGQGPTAP